MEEYPIFDFSPDNLPEGYLEAIGLVTAHWAQAEWALKTLIGSCLGVDILYAQAVTTHMPAPLRDSVARAVAEIRIEDLDVLDELDDILDRLNNAAVLRNNAAHRSWCRDQATGQVFAVVETARGSIKSELVPVSVDQIKADAAEINRATLALISFLSRNGLDPIFPDGEVDLSGRRKAVRKARRKQAGTCEAARDDHRS